MVRELLCFSRVQKRLFDKWSVLEVSAQSFRTRVVLRPPASTVICRVVCDGRDSLSLAGRCVARSPEPHGEQSPVVCVRKRLPIPCWWVLDVAVTNKQELRRAACFQAFRTGSLQRAQWQHCLWPAAASGGWPSAPQQMQVCKSQVFNFEQIWRCSLPFSTASFKNT